LQFILAEEGRASGSELAAKPSNSSFDITLESVRLETAVASMKQLALEKLTLALYRSATECDADHFAVVYKSPEYACVCILPFVPSPSAPTVLSCERVELPDGAVHLKGAFQASANRNSNKKTQ
jgi:hypothetical protein